MGGLLKLSLEAEHTPSTHILAIKPNLILKELGKCRLCDLDKKNIDFGKQVAILI